MTFLYKEKEHTNACSFEILEEKEKADYSNM